MDFKRTMGMTDFEKKVYLYQTGQITESQWQGYLEDETFANYVKVRLGK